ncbi:extracellular solute-binding protein [Erysipelothrix sp. HDW6C]|uniref:extracellular solute-binding protein n=1 Tax=Erysipelothrix sp. HDW6C TaxID=2714930 RepID=UPI00140AFE09|nr:extracellular solute-binding protein [Erysipelothrix sp. HDW6C]QIK69413.1 extracellular solute-binding protein [Erysipelothrix sp. HDW6C]
MKTKVTLVILLALMLLVGCGQATTDKTVLTFWGHQNDAWAASYREIADKYEVENPDIKIEFEFYPYDQFESKVQTSLISKEGGADIYELWGGWAIDFAPTGSLEKMPTAFEEEIRKDSYPSTYGALEHEGHLYGIPLEFNIENGGMLVNNALLEAKSIAVPTTWADLKTAAVALTEKEGDLITIKGFDFVNWDSVPYLFTSMILSQGGSYQQEDGTFTFNTEEGRKAFSELHSLVADLQVTNMEGLSGGGDMEGYQQLYSGRAAIVPRGVWTVAEGMHTFGLEHGKDFSYVSMPWFGAEPKFAAETGWSLAVNASSDKKEEALKFLEFFYKDENLLQHNIKSAQVPSKKSIAHDAKLLEEMPYVEPLVSVLDKAQFIGYFNTDVFKEAINEVFQEYEAGHYGSVEDALKAIEAKLNK